MPAIAFGSIDLISRSDLYMRVWSHGPNCGWLNWSVKFRICFHISPTYIHTRHHISHVFLWIYWNNAALTISILIRWWIFISILCFFIFDKKLKKKKEKNWWTIECFTYVRSVCAYACVRMCLTVLIKL